MKAKANVVGDMRSALVRPAANAVQDSVGSAWIEAVPLLDMPLAENNKDLNTSSLSMAISM